MVQGRLETSIHPGAVHEISCGQGFVLFIFVLHVTLDSEV